MKGAPAVDILLATWNGERYLAEQIDSILAQSYSNWRLLIRDDGSSDGTRDIIGRYVSENPERLELIEGGAPGLGACGNFAYLMAHATSDYVMFCDQDDVWLPHKAERLLEEMQRLEEQHGTDQPLLVHSDLKVVGPDLEVWHPSFMEYQALDTRFGRSLNRLLVQNVVTGCASLCNRPLIERSLPVPDHAAMHDRWIALVAVVFGKIRFVDEATVLYRQHGGNTLGAKKRGWHALLRWLALSPDNARNTLRMVQDQGAALLAMYGDAMPPDKRRVLENFVDIRNQGFVARRLALLRNGFLGAGVCHKLAFLVFV